MISSIITSIITIIMEGAPLRNHTHTHAHTNPSRLHYACSDYGNIAQEKPQSSAKIIEISGIFNRDADTEPKSPADLGADRVKCCYVAGCNKVTYDITKQCTGRVQVWQLATKPHR